VNQLPLPPLAAPSNHHFVSPLLPFLVDPLPSSNALSLKQVLLKSFTDDDIAPGSPPGSSLEAPLAPEDFSVNPRVPENSSKGSACEPKVPQGGLNSALYACALTGWMGVFNVRYIHIYIYTHTIPTVSPVLYLYIPTVSPSLGTSPLPHYFILSLG
jgi:hypothetical protein